MAASSRRITQRIDTAAESHRYDTKPMIIPFQAFNEYGEVRVYKHGLLPHWRQDGCSYFVTFRQNDSLPQSVLEEIKKQRSTWLRRHDIDPDHLEWREQFANLSKEQQREYERDISIRLDDALDKSHGSCQLRETKVAKIVANALTHFHKTRVWTGDYVIMPNHVHALMTPLEGFELEDVLHSIKSFTANQINEHLGTEGVFWQKESYDHIVRNSEQLKKFQKYVSNNPVKARLTENNFIHKEAEYDLIRSR